MLVSALRLQPTDLVPADQEVSVRVLKEPANVCSNERETGNRVREDHGQGHLEVFPRCLVVTCPYSA